MNKKILSFVIISFLSFFSQVTFTESALAGLERRITIKVIDEQSGKPIKGATAGYLAGLGSIELPTDANGKVSLGMAEEKTYKIFAHHPEYKNVQQEIIINSSTSKNLEVTLAMQRRDGAFINFTLTAQDNGQPVPEARIYLGGSVLKAVYSGVTDASGKLSLFVTDGGKYTAEIYHDNFKKIKDTLEVNIYAGQKEYPLSYALERTARVERGDASSKRKELMVVVNIKDEQGNLKPFSGAKVDFLSGSALTNQAGVVVFKHYLEIGTYEKIYIQAEGYEPKVESIVVGQGASFAHQTSAWQRWIKWATSTPLPTDTLVETTLEPKPKEALAFIVEVTDTENDKLIENAYVEIKLCNPAVVDGKEKEFFAAEKTATGRAKFTIPADMLKNICRVQASHPGYESSWSDIAQELLTLSNEPRRFMISLKRRAEQSSGPLAGLSWELTKVTEDPDKKSGVAIGGYNICDSLNKSGASIRNERFPQSKSSVQCSGNIPEVLKPGDKFTITITSSCVTENDYCCLDAGVATEGIECKPADRVGGCAKSINATQTYECVAPKSPYYDTLAVVPFVGGLGPMARYEYTKKRSE